MTQEACDIYCYDEQKVAHGKELLATNDVRGMARIFKALADETRMKIAYALCQEEELCVCDVANIIGSTVANTSHHLRLLKNSGLARHRKEGKLIFYSLDDDHVKQMIHLTMVHYKEGKNHG
ncbi:ArsR/SmtB family transcription factor [Brevibacillus centrosporus]|jgi:DNA-binding transcriptional ArsR family regulator|uniref:ArsR/SmtB family transcription factor n=1 Tax=Brevibacillus TaxID=55080 RepID=UPI0039863C8F